MDNPENEQSSRQEWIKTLDRVIRTPLALAANGALKTGIPHGTSEQHEAAALETTGRILAGISPWLDAACGDEDEVALRSKYQDLVIRSLRYGCDSDHQDFWGFGRNRQSLVDAAFLAQAVLRSRFLRTNAPNHSALVNCLTITRRVNPNFNNWLLFSACIEAALYKLGHDPDLMRIDYALRQHQQWYVGDGVYCDGPHYQADYYNSFVIHPMISDILDTFTGFSAEWDRIRDCHNARAQRYAVQQERMIASDGSWPPIGRSLTYRCGAFHALAAVCLKGMLPPHVTPGQVRGALTAAIKKSLFADGTFSADGWLNVGLCGNQPKLAESYITVPSQYLACCVFLPLGLSDEDPFWTEEWQAWTQMRVWNCQQTVECDKGLKD